MSPIEHENNPEKDGLMIAPDPSKFAAALNATVGFLKGVLPDATRKKIYSITKWFLGPLAAIGGVTVFVGPAVGGEVGDQIVLIGGAVGFSAGLLLSALANLAGENIHGMQPGEV